MISWSSIKDELSLFKSCLAGQSNERTSEKLCKATLNGTMAQLKRLFQRQAGYPDNCKKFSYPGADYFIISEKGVRIVSVKRGQRLSTFKQKYHTIAQMPARTEIDHRNRALIAFILPTRVRDGAGA